MEEDEEEVVVGREDDVCSTDPSDCSSFPLSPFYVAARPAPPRPAAPALYPETPSRSDPRPVSMFLFCISFIYENTIKGSNFLYKPRVWLLLFSRIWSEHEKKETSHGSVYVCFCSFLLIFFIHSHIVAEILQTQCDKNM